MNLPGYSNPADGRCNAIQNLPNPLFNLTMRFTCKIHLQTDLRWRIPLDHRWKTGALGPYPDGSQ